MAMPLEGALKPATKRAQRVLSGEAPAALLPEGVLNPNNCQRSGRKVLPAGKLQGIHKLIVRPAALAKAGTGHGAFPAPGKGVSD